MVDEYRFGVAVSILYNKMEFEGFSKRNCGIMVMNEHVTV